MIKQKEDDNMNIAVRYYTKTGNTKRLAEAVAKAVGTEAQPVSVPVTESVDILFLGNSYYASALIPRYGLLSGAWIKARSAGSLTSDPLPC